MPELAERFRFVEPEPLTDIEVVQHAIIDILAQRTYLRMHDLAPEPRNRHWYSVNGLTSRKPGVTYIPEHDHSTQMTALLETVHWRKGYGPSRREATTNEIEVNLITLAKPLHAERDTSRHYPRRRVSAAAGRLTIFASDLFTVNLKKIYFGSATNILTDISDTLDLIEQTSE